MVLYMIGLGLGDEDDITVKGLKVRAESTCFSLFAHDGATDARSLYPKCSR